MVPFFHWLAARCKHGSFREFASDVIRVFMILLQLMNWLFVYVTSPAPS